MAYQTSKFLIMSCLLKVLKTHLYTFVILSFQSPYNHETTEDSYGSIISPVCYLCPVKFLFVQWHKSWRGSKGWGHSEGFNKWTSVSIPKM